MKNDTPHLPVNSVIDRCMRWQARACNGSHILPTTQLITKWCNFPGPTNDLGCTDYNPITSTFSIAALLTNNGFYSPNIEWYVQILTTSTSGGGTFSNVVDFAWDSGTTSVIDCSAQRTLSFIRDTPITPPACDFSSATVVVTPN